MEVGACGINITISPMSSPSSHTAACTVLIIIVIPFLYLASVPILVKASCAPEPSAHAMGGWRFSRPEPPWLVRYNVPLRWAYANQTANERLEPYFGTYRDWVYSIGH
jgi:hypothetical protein